MTLAMLEVHATLITMIAVLVLVITEVLDPNLQIREGGAEGPPLDPPRRGTQLQTHIKFCCTQQCTYNPRKVFSSDF